MSFCAYIMPLASFLVCKLAATSQVLFLLISETNFQQYLQYTSDPKVWKKTIGPQRLSRPIPSLEDDQCRANIFKPKRN